MSAKHDISIGVIRNKRLVHRKDAAVYRNTGPVFAIVADPKTGREWKWKESDQPGLLDFLRQFVRAWHRPAVAGNKVSAGGRKGANIAYGTTTERHAKWGKYQDFVDAQDRSLRITERRRLAAKEFGVSLKTIIRHTK